MPPPQPTAAMEKSMFASLLSLDDDDAHGPQIAKEGSLEHGETVLAPFGLESPHLPHALPIQAGALPPPLMESEDERRVKNGSPVSGHGSFCSRLLAFTGPGWLMSIAYVDPGNIEADLQCGAQFGYRLLWALMWATAIGLGMQLVAARLGCATHRHLAEHCRAHYGPRSRVLLWFFTELAIIGSDIQEVIGCSIGLEMLFGIPLSMGVLVTAAAAFCFLFLERLGVRKLELFFGLLILVLAASMGGLFAVIRPDAGAIFEGLAVPRMSHSEAQQVVGMIGCIVMPHNLFLHSALVQSRVVAKGDEREAIFLFTVESTCAICTSLLINMSVLAVFAKGFFGSVAAGDIGLRNAGGYLGTAYGDEMRVIWALGLVAAGQSSTMTGAYAGQWVMQGYLELKVEPWKRAVITRGMALIPTLAVAVYFGGGNNGLDALNGYLNILQSFVLPFAVVPLLSFAGARSVMGEFALRPHEMVLSWLAALLVVTANVYLFFVKFQDDLPMWVLGVGAAVYGSLVIHVAWAPRKSLQSFRCAET